MDKFEEVKKVIMDVLKIDGKDITPETRFVEDLKADSMDLFFLMDGFGEKFGVTISDDEAMNIKTVGDVVEIISR